MKTKLAAVTIVGAFLAAAMLAVWISSGGGQTTQASPTLSLGVDADPAGNTATSLGAIESCRQVNVGDTFDIDIWVADVGDVNGFELWVTYDPAILEVTGENSSAFLLGSAPGSSVSDWSDLHHPPGFSWVAAKDMAHKGESGSGVLSRLTLHAVAPGIRPITLEKNLSGRVPRLEDTSGNSIAPTVGDRDKDGDDPDPLSSCHTTPGYCTGEDPVDGIDNDGDGREDEDPPDGAFDGPIFNGQIAVGQPCTDSDGDGVPDADELSWGSDPANGNSTPEDDAYDPGTCTDGLDNDGDGDTDSEDEGCAVSGPPTPTPGLTPTPGTTPTPDLTPTPGTTPTPDLTPTPTPTPSPGTVNLASGWNNSCYVGAAQSIEDALADVADHAVAVYRLRPDQGFDRWFRGRPAVSTMTTVDPHEPLFILMAQSAVWVHEPVDTPPTSVPLTPGWNSVCYMGESKTTEAATAEVSSQIGVMYSLAPDQTWRRFIPGRPGVSNLDELYPSISVLVLVTDPGGAQWVFDA